MTRYRTIVAGLAIATTVTMGITASRASTVPHATSVPATVVTLHDTADRTHRPTPVQPKHSPALPAKSVRLPAPVVDHLTVPTPGPVTVAPPIDASSTSPRPPSKVTTHIAARPAVKPHNERIAAPVWHPADCANNNGMGSVDIPATTGVMYALDALPGTAGSYSLNAGLHAVTASGVAESDRTVYPSWSYAVADISAQCPQPPLIDTKPNAGDVPPVWHQATCTSPASVEIPAAPGFIYDLDLLPGPAGNYSLDAGLHTVTASPDTAITPTRAPTWTFTIVTPTGC